MKKKIICIFLCTAIALSLSSCDTATKKDLQESIAISSEEDSLPKDSVIEFPDATLTVPGEWRLNQIGDSDTWFIYPERQKAWIKVSVDNSETARVYDVTDDADILTSAMQKDININTSLFDSNCTGYDLVSHYNIGGYKFLHEYKEDNTRIFETVTVFFTKGHKYTISLTEYMDESYSDITTSYYEIVLSAFVFDEEDSTFNVDDSQKVDHSESLTFFDATFTIPSGWNTSYKAGDKTCDIYPPSTQSIITLDFSESSVGGPFDREKDAELLESMLSNEIETFESYKDFKEIKRGLTSSGRIGGYFYTFQYDNPAIIISNYIYYTDGYRYTFAFGQDSNEYSEDYEKDYEDMIKGMKFKNS